MSPVPTPNYQPARRGQLHEAAQRWRNDQLDASLLDAALGGDKGAVRRLVDAIAPVVQARVARVLLRRGSSNMRGDLEDLCQEVFVALFTKDAHTLRTWQPSSGLSFANFVGLVAQRRALSIQHKRGVLPEDFDAEDSGTSAEPQLSSLERTVESKQVLVRLLEALELSLTPRGYDLFFRLYIEQQSPSKVGQHFGLSQNAVHQWRRRLGCAARQALSTLSLDAGDSPRQTPPVLRGATALAHFPESSSPRLTRVTECTE